MRNLKTIFFIIVVVLNYILCANLKLKVSKDNKKDHADFNNALLNMSIEELEMLNKTTGETIEEIGELKKFEDSNEELLKDLELDDEDLEFFDDEDEDN